MVKETNYGTRFNAVQGMYIDIDADVKATRGILTRIVGETRRLAKNSADQASEHLRENLFGVYEDYNREGLGGLNDPGLRKAIGTIERYQTRLDAKAFEEELTEFEADAREAAREGDVEDRDHYIEMIAVVSTERADKLRREIL